MSTQQEVAIGHVVLTPGTCGGAPRIAGTRIRVSQIVLMTELGMSPDEIVNSFPHLTLGQVHGALSYYHDHHPQIDDEIRGADEEFRRLSGRA
ncbi:MAG: DUF433 domain-containing protein [Pirellulaceae bacterium]